MFTISVLTSKKYTWCSCLKFCSYLRPNWSTGHTILTSWWYWLKTEGITRVSEETWMSLPNFNCNPYNSCSTISHITSKVYFKIVRGCKDSLLRTCICICICIKYLGNTSIVVETKAVGQRPAYSHSASKAWLKISSKLPHVFSHRQKAPAWKPTDVPE